MAGKRVKASKTKKSRRKSSNSRSRSRSRESESTYLKIIKVYFSYLLIFQIGMLGNQLKELGLDKG